MQSFSAYPSDKFPILLGNQTTTVRITSKDPAGNIGLCEIEVLVLDVEAPVVTLRPSPVFVLSAELGRQPTVLIRPIDVIESVTDNFDSSLVRIVQPPAEGVVLGVGVHNVNISVVDVFNNTASLTSPVQILDTTPPVMTSCPDVELTAGDGGTVSGKWADPIADDNSYDHADNRTKPKVWTVPAAGD